MEKKFEFPASLRNISFVLIAVGLAAFAYGFFTSPERTWASFLMENALFLGFTIGSAFFLAIQYITQSGWSAQFKRIPEAISMYLPVAALLSLLVVAFGTHSIYHWTHADHVAHDHLLQHKQPFLNWGFFSIRYVVYFALWILLTQMLRKWSLREDIEGGLEYFRKSEFYSRILIFVLAFTFSLWAVDWLMSIDAHWFSTIYAGKNFISAFQHGIALIVFIVILLRRAGYFPQANTIHLHDYSRYIFALTIAYGYFWFSQFFLIWFANIPEETYYYVERVNNWHPLMLLVLAFNFVLPFIILLWNRIAKTENGLLVAAVVLFVGYWLDMYEQVMPGIATINPDKGVGSIGIIEIGGFLGFLGLFIFVVARAMSRANIMPVQHPYLEESLQHDGQ